MWQGFQQIGKIVEASNTCFRSTEAHVHLSFSKANLKLMVSNKVTDLEGRDINYWRVLRRATKEEVIDSGRKYLGKAYWVCQCTCEFQTVVVVLGYDLRNDLSKSCLRCSRKRSALARTDNKKHRMSGTKVYRAWQSMKNRCYNPDVTVYENYGGRGIQVCNRWLNSFENFYADMGDPPSNEHSIDRIDVNGNYEPGNVRWATWKEQCRNKRNNIYIEFNGKRQTGAEWAKEFGVPPSTIYSRVEKGLPINQPLRSGKRRMVFEHEGVVKPMLQWSEETGIAYTTLISRQKRGGLTSGQILGLEPMPDWYKPRGMPDRKKKAS